MGRMSRATTRIVIWVVALFVAYFPAYYAAQVPITQIWNFNLVAAKTNAAQAFEEFFYVAVVMAMVTMTSIWDNLLKSLGSQPDWIKAVAFLTSTYFLLTLVVGIVEYARIAGLTHSLVESTFNNNFWAAMITLAVTLMAEAGIAFADP